MSREPRRDAWRVLELTSLILADSPVRRTSPVPRPLAAHTRYAAGTSVRRSGWERLAVFMTQQPYSAQPEINASWVEIVVPAPALSSAFRQTWRARQKGTTVLERPPPVPIGGVVGCAPLLSSAAKKQMDEADAPLKPSVAALYVGALNIQIGSRRLKLVESPTPGYSS